MTANQILFQSPASSIRKRLQLWDIEFFYFWLNWIKIETLDKIFFFGGGGDTWFYKGICFFLPFELLLPFIYSSVKISITIYLKKEIRYIVFLKWHPITTHFQALLEFRKQCLPPPQIRVSNNSPVKKNMKKWFLKQKLFSIMQPASDILNHFVLKLCRKRQACNPICKWIKLKLKLITLIFAKKVIKFIVNC